MKNNKYSVQIIKSIAGLEEDWKKLYDSMPEVSPFLEYHAISICKRYFYPYYISNRCAFRLAVIKNENAEIVALIPLLEYKGGRAQLFGFPNGFNESSFVYDRTKISVAECVKLILSVYPQFEILKVDERTALFELVEKEGENIKYTKNVAINFGGNFDDYFASLSKSVRQNVRTAYNRMKTDDCDFQFRCLNPQDDKHIILSDVIDLYCSRHEERYGVKTGWLKKWFLKHQSFATKLYLKSPCASTFLLTINDKPAAFMSGLRNSERFLVPRLSIASEFKRYSPGLILICETIKYLIANTSIETLDLGQGEESYKYQMGGVEHSSLQANLRITPPCLYKISVRYITSYERNYGSKCA